MNSRWLVVALVGMSGVAHAESTATVNRQDPVKTVAVAGAGYGVVALALQSHVWPLGSSVAFLSVGPMLEWQSDCATHGLQNYVGRDTQQGNGGYLNTYGPVSEEHVKWQQAPNGWMQRKCAE